MFTANSFYVSRINADQLFLGGINTYSSQDGGLTWTLVNEWWEYYGNISGKLHADIPAFNSFLDGAGQEVFVISTDGGCYVSSDVLQTVSNISLEGLHVSQYYSILTNRSNFNVLYAGSQDQGYQRSQSDNGLIMGFEQLLSGDYGHLTSGDGGNSLWHNYPGFTTYYPDASATANYGIDFNAVGMSCNMWMPPIAADPADPALAWLGGGSGNGCSEAYLYRLEFDGNGITASTDYFDFNNGSGNGAISAVAISESDPDYRYVLTTNQSCFYSTDGGSSWNAGAGGMPGNHYFYGNAILVSPQYPATLYVGGSGYSGPAVFKSTDNGQSFTPMGNGLPATMVYALDGTLDGSMLFAATEVGPYIYFAASNQWYALDGLAAPDQVYWDVEFVPELNAARFATYGRGIWDFVICDVNSPEPLADFSYAVDPLNQELSIFNGSSKAYFYEWDFGDGSTSEEAEPVHSYASPGTYPVTLVASTHCSMDTLVQWVSVGTPFPVELLAFEATGLQSSIRLRWEVAQEQGLAFYEVEKQDGNGDFQPLLRVPAAGRSLYQANDDSPRAGLNTYRLRIQEQDGSTRYSSRAEVRWGEAAPRLALTVYPNPILDGQPLQLKIEAPAAGNALIALRSVDGKRVAERSAELKAGTQEIRWELPALSPGVYVALLRMGGGSVACKLEIR
jgi:PKD repeat protein